MIYNLFVVRLVDVRPCRTLVSAGPTLACRVLSGCPSRPVLPNADTTQRGAAAPGSAAVQLIRITPFLRNGWASGLEY